MQIWNHISFKILIQNFVLSPISSIEHFSSGLQSITRHIFKSYTYYILLSYFLFFNSFSCIYFSVWGRRDHMVVGITITYAISAYHHQRCEFECRSGEVYSMQHYVWKFVNDLRQVGGFLLVLRFLPPIKLTATI